MTMSFYIIASSINYQHLQGFRRQNARHNLSGLSLKDKQIWNLDVVKKFAVRLVGLKIYAIDHFSFNLAEKHANIV